MHLVAMAEAFPAPVNTPPVCNPTVSVAVEGPVI